LTSFFTAPNVVVQSRPPVSGTCAAAGRCRVLSAPATAARSYEFAGAGSPICTDNISVNFGRRHQAGAGDPVGWRGSLLFVDGREHIHREQHQQG
jgi:hypothetical protein